LKRKYNVGYTLNIAVIDTLFDSSLTTTATTTNNNDSNNIPSNNHTYQHTTTSQSAIDRIIEFMSCHLQEVSNIIISFNYIAYPT